jgi:hypothetical protein
MDEIRIVDLAVQLKRLCDSYISDTISVQAFVANVNTINYSLHEEMEKE